MALFSDKRWHIMLSVTVLVLLSLMLVGGAKSSAASPQTGRVTSTPATPAAKPILLTDPVPDPKQAGVIWFAATGHTLRGAFLDYWQKNGGLAQFGYPLTEEFFEEVGVDKTLVRVQYFERNRFEVHSENQPPNDVQLGLFGAVSHQPDQPAAPTAGAQYFMETGHNLDGTFKTYWETHGGLAIHGYPISEPFMETNPTDHKQYTVQYFQRSRFELHPENAGSSYEVLLGALGRQLSEKQGYPYGWYPRYGYAVDYSWVAGKLLPPLYCLGGVCDCPRIGYNNPNELITPWGDGWTSAIERGVTNYLVLIGQRQSNAELDPTCNPNFKVDSVQKNPSDATLH